MFIREKSKKANGKKRSKQHQLIESVRTPSGPRQHIVLNLGQLSLPEEKWKELANCIEGFLANQRTLFPGDPVIEAKARHYASQIRQERLGRVQECLAAEEAAHYERVDVNSLITSDAKTVGAEHVVISHMNEYGFDKILKGLEFTREQITYSKMLIAGRMVPGAGLGPDRRLDTRPQAGHRDARPGRERVGACRASPKKLYICAVPVPPHPDPMPPALGVRR